MGKIVDLSLSKLKINRLFQIGYGKNAIEHINYLVFISKTKRTIIKS